MRLALLVVVAFALRNVVAIPPSWDQLDESYTFERYVEDFAKSYSKDEWDQRKDIFGRNLVRILAHNRQRKTGHVLGVNQFMDFKPEEVPTGHDKRYQRARAVSLDRSSRTPHSIDLPFEIDDVATLPSDVDWRRAGIVTPVKDQGMCGSCWAFASTAALESHIAQETGLLFSLSVQELVSCSPNTRECGGQGGCLGSTAELAYDFVASEGMVEEWRFGYASYNGEKVACSLLDRNLRGVDGSVVTIDGYAVTPLNDYVAVMNAVAKYGPVVVNVAAHEWSLYAGGVFHSMSNKPSSYDINHDVVLVGYGTDEATGEDYWLIRNSWSPQWGEHGYIRLKREDPSKMDNADDDCGMDISPFDGDVCAEDENGDPVPATPVKVCGTSGAYYLAVLPVGGRLDGQRSPWTSEKADSITT